MLEGIRTIVNSKSKTFRAFCFCFLISVAIISIAEWNISFRILLTVSFVLLGILIAVWEHKMLRFVTVVMLCVVGAFFCYSVVLPGESSFLFNEKNTFAATVIHEPDIRTDGVRYIIETTEHERVFVKSALYPRYEYGDVLEIVCTIKKPEPIESFRYDKYLAKDRVFATCAQPEIKATNEWDGNAVLHRILKTKQQLAETISQLWHEPQASFMAGLLYGYRGGLGSLNELFNVTGVTHIVAISGFNITIIATILMIISTHLLIPRKKAFWLITFGIILFVIFVGMSASVVRAGVMAIILLIGKQIGRSSRIGNVLLLTAAVMTFVNPLVLVWDAGFQLSFLATMGLVYLVPLFENKFRFIPETLGFRETIIATLSATLATLPLILFQFERLSLVAIVVNVLVVWIVPWIMLAGFAAVLFGLFSISIGRIIAIIGAWGMQYIISVVTWFASLPFAAVDVSIPWWLMVTLYGGMVYFVFMNQKKTVYLYEHS